MVRPTWEYMTTVTTAYWTQHFLIRFIFQLFHNLLISPWLRYEHITMSIFPSYWIRYCNSIINTLRMQSLNDLVWPTQLLAAHCCACICHTPGNCLLNVWAVINTWKKIRFTVMFILGILQKMCRSHLYMTLLMFDLRWITCHIIVHKHQFKIWFSYYPKIFKFFTKQIQNILKWIWKYLYTEK